MAQNDKNVVTEDKVTFRLKALLTVLSGKEGTCQKYLMGFLTLYST